jgi:hypothetical protein
VKKKKTEENIVDTQASHNIFDPEWTAGYESIFFS